MFGRTSSFMYFSSNVGMAPSKPITRTLLGLFFNVKVTFVRHRRIITLNKFYFTMDDWTKGVIEFENGAIGVHEIFLWGGGRDF